MNRIPFLLLLILTSCSQSPDTSDQDFSHIDDPAERWAAYQLSDYTIDQEVICFCLPPHSFTIQVENGEIDDVFIDPEKAAGWDMSIEELKTIGLQKARTVDEVFELIAVEGAGAAVFEVVYDSLYGYPTHLYLDLDSAMADEEIRIDMSNLRF